MLLLDLVIFYPSNTFNRWFSPKMEKPTNLEEKLENYNL